MLIDKTVKITAILVGALVLFGIAHPALAQAAGTVTFTVTPATGNSPLAQTATWSTSPVATSCVASDGWTGTKAASGTAVLPAVTSDTNYTLTCSWPGSPSTATVSWTAPTTNTDGSALTNLASYKVVYGTSATALTQNKVVADPAAVSTSITGLTSGTWFFATRASNTLGVESGNSNVASKVVVVAPVTAAKTVNVVVNKVPSPPTNTTVEITITMNLSSASPITLASAPVVTVKP